MTMGGGWLCNVGSSLQCDNVREQEWAESEVPHVC